MNQSLSLTLPPTGLLNANQRPHWTAKARRTREIRSLVAWLARPLMTVTTKQRVTFTFQWPDNRLRDAENWAPTGKACIDGLRDGGVLPQDDGRWVASVTYQQGPKFVDWRDSPMVKITIELEDAA